jgi:hypothetical protein
LSCSPALDATIRQIRLNLHQFVPNSTGTSILIIKCLEFEL